MSKEVLFIEGRREGYAVDQIRRTMTVGELIEYLSEFYDEDTEIYLNNNNGYTFGSITESSFTMDCVEDESEED